MSDHSSSADEALRDPPRLLLTSRCRLARGSGLEYHSVRALFGVLYFRSFSVRAQFFGARVAALVVDVISVVGPSLARR